MPPFRALALATWRKVVLDVSITRADGAAATWEKTSKRELVSTRLAYSTTSSSAETSFLARRCTQRQARQPKRLRAVSRQPTDQRARRGLARDAAAGLNPLRALWQPEGCARSEEPPDAVSTTLEATTRPPEATTSKDDPLPQQPLRLLLPAERQEPKRDRCARLPERRAKNRLLRQRRGLLRHLRPPRQAPLVNE